VVIRWRVAIAAAVALVAVCAIRFAIAHWDSVYDDAFIYLRYVRNLNNGCGLRFNCADAPVEGFTGPLYLALLWGGSLATGQLIWLCQVIGTVSLVVALGVAVWACARLADPAEPGYISAGLALGAAIVLGADDFVLLNSVIGLESALAAAVFAAVAFAALTDRPRLLAASACAFTLVRPEALLFLLALPLLPSMRRVSLLAAVVGFLVALTAARYVLFDSLAPNTYYAKSGGTAQHALLGLAYIRDAFLDFPLAMLAPLALFGRHRRAATYLMTGSAAWLGFFLRSGGDTFEYSRMWFPLVPMLTVLAIIGGYELARRRLSPRIALAVVGALVGAIAVRALVAHSIPEQHVNPRVVEWAATGTYLREHYPRGTLVATVPIGAIGYYSSLPILDLVGLTEPAIARAGRSVPPELLTKRWIAHERNNTEYVLERAPAVIVTTMVQERPWSSIAESRAGFWADWELLQEIKSGRAPYRVRDAEVMPGKHLLMFERVAAP
jgi:arabinofuranosyltransferase